MATTRFLGLLARFGLDLLGRGGIASALRKASSRRFAVSLSSYSCSLFAMGHETSINIDAKSLNARWLRAVFHFDTPAAPSTRPLSTEVSRPAYTVSNELPLAAAAPAVRKGPVGKCIYCGATEFEPGTRLPLSEEHIIPEGLGARLILSEASCKACAERINFFETRMLGSLLLAPRRQLNIRGKKRKRDQKDYPVTTVVGGKDVVLRVPLQFHPTTLFLPVLNAPGVLCGRSQEAVGIQGLSIHELNDLQKHSSGQKFTTPALDTALFCQFLAKIAHGYAAMTFGIDGFEPVLPELILKSLDKDNWRSGYHWVGGNPMDYSPSDALHLLGWGIAVVDNQQYIVVIIRLFANLGCPVFHVVVGTPNSSRIALVPSAAEPLGYMP